MNEVIAPKANPLDALRQSLAQGSMRHAHRLINALHPAEIAALLESLPAAKREVVWGFIDPEIEGEVLVELNDQMRADRIDGMDAEELVAMTENMEVDDLAHLFGDLPEEVTQRVLHSMDLQDRERLKAMLAYQNGTAGSLMNVDTVTVRPDATVEVVMRHRTPHFTHVFAGDGYAAGYYSYLWADTLVADAWEAFVDSGDVFDPDIAARLREYVFTAGNQQEPDVAYRAFRGRDADVQALMRKRGFV